MNITIVGQMASLGLSGGGTISGNLVITGSLTAVAATFTGVVTVPAGDLTTPGLTVGSTGGIYSASTSLLFKANNIAAGRFVGNTFIANGAVGVNNGASYIESGSSGILQIDNVSGNPVASIGGPGANGQFYTINTVTSLVTLNTGDVTTTGPQIPAGAQVLDVTARVTTAITTAVSWSVGVAGATTRYVNANATMTAGTTALGIDNPRKYTAATDTVITTNANPGAGAIRVTIHYFLATAPTS